MSDKNLPVKFAFENEQEGLMNVPPAVQKGGSGSGHFGHAGIPGHHGGSLPGKGGGAAAKNISKADFKKTYPALYEALNVMGLDNDMKLGSSFNIDPDMVDDMKSVNSILADMQGKTLGDILPADTEWDPEAGFEADADAIESFVAGDEQAQDAIREHLGPLGEDASDFLNEAFDGSYTDLFYHEGSGKMDMSSNAQFDRMDVPTLRRVLDNRKFNQTQMNKFPVVKPGSKVVGYTQQQRDANKSDIEYIERLLRKKK